VIGYSARAIEGNKVVHRKRSERPVSRTRTSLPLKASAINESIRRRENQTRRQIFSLRPQRCRERARGGQLVQLTGLGVTYQDRSLGLKLLCCRYFLGYDLYAGTEARLVYFSGLDEIAVRLRQAFQRAKHDCLGTT
jgi:hypothetical protein